MSRILALLLILLAGPAAGAQRMHINRIVQQGGVINITYSDTDNVYDAIGNADYSVQGSTLTVRSGVLSVGVRQLSELYVEKTAVCGISDIRSSKSILLSVKSTCRIGSISAPEIKINLTDALLIISQLQAKRRATINIAKNSVLTLANAQTSKTTIIVGRSCVADMNALATQQLALSVAPLATVSAAEINADNLTLDSQGNVSLEGYCKKLNIKMNGGVVDASQFHADKIDSNKKRGTLALPGSRRRPAESSKAGRILP